MHTSALSRPRNRLFTAVLAVLLAVPLLVATAPPATADDPNYSLHWIRADGHDWGGAPHTVALRPGETVTLVRTISNVDGTLTEVSDDISVAGDSATLDDCEPFPDEVDEDTERTCTVVVDFAENDTVLEFTGELDHDSETSPPATVTALRMMSGEFAITDTLPIEVEVGDSLTMNLDVTNPGSAPINIDRVRLQHQTAPYNGAVCTGDVTPLQPGETESLSCEVGPVRQDSSHVTVQSLSISDQPPSRGSLTTLDDVFEVQLDDPSVDIVATADPDTLLNGGAADVDVSVENTSDIIFDELRWSVATDAGEACSDSVSDPFDGDVTWQLSAACSVEPAAGDATTVAIHLDYTTGDGVQTYTPDPVVVDLTSESTDLAVEARAGVVNQTLTPPLFVARDVLPLQPDPNFHLGGPATLEVTVSNPGTIDLADVDVAADVPGCADRTFDLDAGETASFWCDGPLLSPGDATATTTVTASADADGTAVEATDTADFSAFGIAAEVTLDPDWDGIDLALPFLITIENVGAHELGWNGAAWQVEDQFGSWDPGPGDTCVVASGDEFAPPADQTPLPVGDAVTHGGCTLLAGDLVDGVTIRAAGVQDPWGETPGSYDLVELQFDPDGAVHGTAELNGDAFAGLDVELRLVELLELPRAEPVDRGLPPLSMAGAGDGDDCTSVGELSATDEDDVVATTTSDADGGFCFDDVPPGTYEIVVDTDVDADLDEIVVDGATGFTANSPATSEPFLVGFASATFGEAVQASLTFSADLDVDEPSEAEPIATDTDDADEELAATGGGATTLTLVALLALLLGAATLATSRRLAALAALAAPEVDES